MRLRAARIAALVLAGAAILLLLAGYLAAASLGWTVRDYLAYGFFSIPVLGLSTVACGGVLAWHRPANLVGWLLLAIGMVAALTTASIALLRLANRDGWAWWSQVMLAQFVMVSWSVWLVLIPLALLAFPSGHYRGRFEGSLAILLGLCGVVTLALLLADPNLGPGLKAFGIAAHDRLVTGPPIALLASTPLASIADWVGEAFFASELLTAVVIVLLIVRFVRGDTRLRRQLLWILLPTLLSSAVLGFQVLPTLLGRDLGSPLALAVFALLPVGVAIAVIRSELFDVRRVFARTLAWTLLSGLLGGAFFLLVALLGGFLVQSASAVVAALAVALAFEPLRRWLQRGVDRLVLGRRAEPEYLIGLVGAGIVGAVDLTGVLRRIADPLRLDWLAVRTEDGVLAAAGRPPERVESLPLRYDDRELATLEVGLDRDTTTIRRGDRRILELVAPVLAALVRLTVLTEELSASRGQLVQSAEEERRRVQRDLHDGVASALGGVAFKIEGIRSRVHDEPDAATMLLGDVHGDVLRINSALRAVINDLTPPELETLGLIGSIRQSAAAMQTRAAGHETSIRIDAPAELVLPAAIEVAAYRIVVEAMANAVRHGDAERIVVELAIDEGALRIEVVDESPRAPQGEWRPGVGLESMQRRTELLGGVFRAGPSPLGGAVDITIPVPAHG